MATTVHVQRERTTFSTPELGSSVQTRTVLLMNETPLTTQQLFEKYGKAIPAPKIGRLVLIERAGKTDEAAFTLGEVTSVYDGGVNKERQLVVKEKCIYFADGRTSVPHRSPVTLPFQHFAKPIQERLRERAERLAAVAQQYQQWSEMPINQNKV